MGQRLTQAVMYASLREYLQDLQDSGVDGLAMECQEPESNVASRAAVDTTHTSYSAAGTLEEIRQQLGDCQRCALSRSRTSIVFGAGNPKARLMFIGEAPTADEDRQGEPFVGESGQILTRIIEAMGLKRQDVYICNLLKCHPPANHTPNKDEVEACISVLLKQIRSINPEVIVSLGTFASQTLLHSKEPISKLRGHFQQFHGIALMPTFHPSFLMRNKENKEHYWEVWRDMEQVLKKLKLPVPEKKKPGSR